MGKGLGAHCTFISPKGLLSASPSPLLCPHHAHRGQADADTISAPGAASCGTAATASPLRGDRRSCVRLELAVGSGGAPFTSDSSCCSQPEDRGAGGVCSPGPLAQGCSQTLSTVTLWGGACTTRENGGQRSKLTYSGSQAVGGGVRLHLSLPGDDGRPNHLLKHHLRASG